MDRGDVKSPLQTARCRAEDRGATFKPLSLDGPPQKADRTLRSKNGTRDRAPTRRAVSRDYGMMAVAWLEKELSRPVEESTAVVT